MSGYPVKSFGDAAPLLRRPFTPAAIKFKVQANFGPKEQPTGGLVVGYIDARLVVERLNLIIPERWSDHYEAFGNGLLWCHLTVDGITRSDVGEGAGKALVSDALKRAAVRFGVGVSLYAVPQTIVNVGPHAKTRRTNKGANVVLTDEGDRYVRDRYANWLHKHGVQAFGEPLDHGDVEGAQGDAEADDAPSAEPTPARAVESVSALDVEELQSAASGLRPSQIKTALTTVGATVPSQITKATAFRDVPKEKAAALARLLSTMPRDTYPAEKVTANLS